MHLRSDSFAHGQPIPVKFAFGKIGDPVELSDNLNPHLAWSGAPDDTRSFVLMCVDPDVPSKPDDVNKSDRQVPADLPRAEFVHWLMVDIPPECRELGEGSCAEGVAPHGKKQPLGPPGARQGINDFTSWFAGDSDMEGDYFGYDGPCPPWNDSIVHHYHFRVYALDVASLGLEGRFTVADVRREMDGHVLAEAALMGTYSLNPKVPA
ncbi:YbhB/YbcL family Raf kinase inhibitor-like protein [Oleiagrimonas sp. C23AA]|uniref:YbhB/YbcL family Raf kinase inhibitor-like protein n=1 Tax=Oleiagrimonas sp. C23AA TaxID=2719047 RepID=UPI0014206C51|nr:YbhB/YbcL family Raf kinase inhibitor-like protein [Oleiagrimonas sp. C23AA]NII10629.1 YbhB/YbcL family Raf kinase inhibitor-like protein [Oleiagrimonas sp. C23AA]